MDRESLDLRTSSPSRPVVNDSNASWPHLFARIDEAKTHLSHSQQAYLGLMYVDPSSRGPSINSGIVDRLKTWCRSKGVTELRLEVYSDNLIAVGAYEKAGF